MMTYGRFHWLFNVPLLAALAWAAGGTPWSADAWPSIALVLAIVMVFTTPWDNYAAKCGIWGFPRERYSLRIGYLPIEEYLFFLLQSLQVMLLVSILLPAGGRDSLASDWGLDSPALWVEMVSLLVIWLAIGWRGRGIGRHSPAHYSWHLLYWFGPVIVAQWLLAWPVFIPRLDIILAATLIIGTWLSAADWIAIRQGIWHFDEQQITGHKLSGKMPWEEVLFFYLTSLIVAQSYLMFLPEALR